MNQLTRILQSEKKHMENLIRKSNNDLSKEHGGSIRVSRCKNTYQYYILEPETSKSRYRYLHRSERQIAKDIIQHDYATSVNELATKRHYHIEQLLQCQDEIADQALNGFSEGRQVLIDEYEQPKQKYIAEWIAKEYQGNTYPADEHEYYTKKGERVKSKSEIIIADTLYDMGIPYRYEYPFFTATGATIYPDFNILNPYTLHEAYLEHFGLMDDSEYVQKTLYKIAEFARNGYHLGHGLLATFESDKSSLDTRLLRDMLENWLERF